MISREIYVSTDIETDGPCPGLHSMLSIGSAAFTSSGTLIDKFSANLVRLPDADEYPETKRWWATQPEAWAAHRVDLQDPEDAMNQYDKWLFNLPGKPVFVGYPAGFDFTFVYWYLHNFVGECRFGFQAIDIKTYAMAVLKKSFGETVKYNMPKTWFPTDLPHTHVALDDAIKQGVIFMWMKKFNEER